MPGIVLGAQKITRVRESLYSWSSPTQLTSIHAQHSLNNTYQVLRGPATTLSMNYAYIGFCPFPGLPIEVVFNPDI